MADQSSSDYPAAIYYAFKQSEIQEEGISWTGWATFLAAVIEAGYQIVGTWPVRTERDTGLKVGVNVLCQFRRPRLPQEGSFSRGHHSSRVHSRLET